MSTPPAGNRDAKRIVGVISFMNVGGSQAGLLRLARALRARGHAVDVWSVYEKARFDDDDVSTAIVAAPRLSPLGYLRAFLRLASRFRRARPDAVVGFLPLGNVFGLSAAALAGVPRRVASQHAPASTYGALIGALDRAIGASGIYHSNVCVSEAVRASFAGYPRRYRDKLRVIPNGVDWTPPGIDRAEARRRLGVPAEAALIAAIGRLEEQKNYALLIDALEGVDGAILAIVGDGALRPALEARARSLGIADRVSFLGRVDRASVEHLLVAADVFAQPSLYEGQSVALIEAMFAGLPIVASDIVAQRETLTDEAGNAVAVLAPLGDVAAWNAAITRLLDDSQYAETIGLCAENLARRRFSLGRMVDAFERALIG